MFHNQTVALQLLMEERMRDKKKKKKKERQTSDETKNLNPLKELNRFPRTYTKNCSSICSSSSSISIEAPKGCLWLLPSSRNSNPSSSSSSSSSRSHLQRKPKSFSKKPITTTSKSAPNSTRPGSKVPSKENDLPKPTSQNSRKNPSFLSQWHSGNKPSSKTSQRSKLSADLSKTVKNPASGSGKFGVNKKNRDLGEPTDFNFTVADNLNDMENFTPPGKLVCGPSVNYAIVDDKPVGEESNSAKTIVKTPPIEASVSPEIQCGSSNIILDSTATPVCYGAGHLISGVTDKRKCRPRGILIIGDPTDSSDCGEISIFEDDGNDNADNILTKSRTSLIPLPAEASMRWLLSPHGEENEVQKDDSSNAYRPLTSSTSICASSSPSTYCQFPSDLVSDSGDKNDSGHPDAITSTGKTRIVLLSPRRVPIFQGFSKPSSEKKDGDSSATPQAKSSCKTDHMQKEGDSSKGFIGVKTPSSVDPLSSSNIVQTPTSDSSPDRHIGISCIGADDFQRDDSDPELGLTTEIFHRTGLAPSQMPMWYPPGLSSQFTDLTSPSHSIDHIPLGKNLDNCASWISDSTVGNVSLSQMRISWREGLASRIFYMDEYDCCRCLSDEDNNGDGSHEFQHKSPKDFEVEEHDSFRSDGLTSPEFLDKEPEILSKGKEALPPIGPNICAESISTDAGGLVASGDSDWTLCYKNQLFEV